MAWTLANGQIPEDLQVMHSCDNPKCVNPSHLNIGTQTDNERDKVSKGRNRRGSAVVGSKLTEEMVMRIRVERRPDTAWAKELGVHSTTIGNARRGKKWGHLPLILPDTNP